MEKQKYPAYEIGDRVKVNTGNADGSIPSLPNYRARVSQVIDREHVIVDACDGDRFSVHVARLTKIVAPSSKH